MTEASVTEIVQACRQRLADYYGNRLKEVLLHGSALRGDSVSLGDIDLLVVLSGALDYFAELRAIVDTLYPLQLECGYMISAKPAAEADYAAGTIQLYRNVKEEGVAV